MTSIRENVARLGHDVIGSAKKRRQISRTLKKIGFRSLGKGAWLGHKSADVVSGFLIEGSPLDTYISTFVLPTFDRLRFVSWSLGQRVVHCSLDGDTDAECDQALTFYKNDIAGIDTSADLLDYIEHRDLKGHYPIWVRYLCHLNDLNLQDGENWLNIERLAQMHIVEREKFAEINPKVVARDKMGVSKTLESWKTVSEGIFGSFNQKFSAL